MIKNKVNMPHHQYYATLNYKMIVKELSNFMGKISNNSSFLDKDKRIYGTFSHYSQFVTDGALLITDFIGYMGYFILLFILQVKV